MTAAPTRALSEAADLELSAYREEYVRGRVLRALDREGVAHEAALATLLADDAEARSRFRRSVAISVSGLFRDPAQFDVLEQELLPPLVADGRRLRVWSAGCADGSELYSVAVVLDRLGALERSSLLGSDLLEENLAVARAGVFGQTAFDARMRARLRWERRDLVRDGTAPGPWSLILCRNLAIYLAPDAKDRLHERLAASLAPGGVLLLGRAERLARPGELRLERAGPHAYRRPL
ncbi:MAG: CheR family methyltransferase [Gaiellaceae bacterium]